MLRTFQIQLEKLVQEETGDDATSGTDRIIAIGCSSGKHRSVAFVERLSAEPCWAAMGIDVSKEHRDVLK